MNGKGNKNGNSDGAHPIRELSRERYAALERFVAESPPGRWLILTHDNPDPDALTAAAILERLLRHCLKQKVTVAYGGLIGRAENREMVKGLQLKMSRVRHLNFKQYAYFALVDTQPRTGNNSLPEDIVPTVILDHHPPRKATASAPLADIRTEYGASATIAAEYLLAAGASLTHSLATALVYAIRSETQDFAREAAGPDRAVYDAVFPRVNKRLLGKIQNAPLSPTYFRSLHDALENLHTVDTLILTHLGDVAQPDIVPEIADLLLRMEGKTWSLCTGRYEGRIYLSIRTTNPRANAGQLMRRLVGRRGKGGGHSMLAGGWIEPKTGTPEAAQTRLGERLARMLRKKVERLGPMELG
jgi:nanoRNase/pAp phosphatase (c-di-AMP/oligoRNAs hydrolase)